MGIHNNDGPFENPSKGESSGTGTTCRGAHSGIILRRPRPHAKHRLLGFTLEECYKREHDSPELKPACPFSSNETGVRRASLS